MQAFSIVLTQLCSEGPGRLFSLSQKVLLRFLKLPSPLKSRAPQFPYILTRDTLVKEIHSGVITTGPKKQIVDKSSE